LIGIIRGEDKISYIIKDMVDYIIDRNDLIDYSIDGLYVLEYSASQANRYQNQGFFSFFQYHHSR
jgi:hypothetical protein